MCANDKRTATETFRCRCFIFFFFYCQSLLTAKKKKEVAWLSSQSAGLSNRRPEFKTCPDRWICSWYFKSSATLVIYSYFERGGRKNVHATIPKGNMGYDQQCILSSLLLLLSFSTGKRTSLAFRAFLPIFYEEQWNQNHPQYFSGWSRSHFFDNLSRNTVHIASWFTPLPVGILNHVMFH